MDVGAEGLLRQIIETEDAGMEHSETCDICKASRGRARCEKGIALAKDNIEALLRAKMWLDQKDGVQSAPFRARLRPSATLVTGAVLAGALLDRLVS